VPALQKFDFFSFECGVHLLAARTFFLHLPPGKAGCDCLPVRLATIFDMPCF
jgi:hypothetical protein